MTDDPMSSAPRARLYVEDSLSCGASISLASEKAHYVTHVMRGRVGDSFGLFDDRTGEWEARLVDVGRRTCRLHIMRQLAPRETVVDLWLLAAPLKRGRIDWVAEKACELGVARLIPILTQHTVVPRLNLDRLRAHMIEAAEQCGRTALPKLDAPCALDALLADWPRDRQLLFCDEEGGPPLADVARAGPAAILIGPEGGLSVPERQTLGTVGQGVGLGPRILRADTAAVAAISLWQAALGDWQ